MVKEIEKCRTEVEQYKESAGKAWGKYKKKNQGSTGKVLKRTGKVPAMFWE